MIDTSPRTGVTGSRTALLLAMCAGMFLVQLDVTVVNVALPAIGTDLHADLPQLQWIVDGYAVVLAALLLTGGTIGDLRGHRPVLLTGFALFGLASAGAALAWSGPVLVAWRVVQGLGAALLLPGTLAVITATHPEPRERARALGLWAGVSAVALSAGPLLGGVLVATAGWRPLFWLNLPLTALALLVTARLLGSGTPDRHRRIDWPGAALAAVALSAAVFAVIRAGRPGTLPAVLVAVLAVLAFGWSQWRGADPMLPLWLLRSHRFTGANLVAAAMNFAGLGIILVATLYLQTVLGTGPLGAALRLLPLFGPLAVLAPVAGRLTGRFGARPVMLAGLLIGTLGLLNLVLVRPELGYPALLPTLLGLGLGMGLLTTPVVAAAVGAVPAERAGLASGVNNTARQAAGALGVAVFGAMAGEPADPQAFTEGVHRLGLLAGGLWLATAVLTLVTIGPCGTTTTGQAKSAVKKSTVDS